MGLAFPAKTEPRLPTRGSRAVQTIAFVFLQLYAWTLEVLQTVAFWLEGFGQFFVYVLGVHVLLIPGVSSPQNLLYIMAIHVCACT